jgi:flagellar basal-body rod modification protein FlgD
MTTPFVQRNSNPASEADSLPVSSRPAHAAQESPGALATKEVFLQLLVAQIRHQNPLNPANGTEFVAQLAQFSQLEATLAIRQDLAKIREVLAPSDSEGK